MTPMRVKPPLPYPTEHRSVASSSTTVAHPLTAGYTDAPHVGQNVGGRGFTQHS
jgi:hypothetical protein